jgi:hypothetical protein
LASVYIPCVEPDAEPDAIADPPVWLPLSCTQPVTVSVVPLPLLLVLPVPAVVGVLPLCAVAATMQAALMANASAIGV